MSRQTATVTFQALELKGSLLPASLLEEVSKFNRPKELLLEPHDYGLGKGERLRDRIDAAWVLTKELWDEYTNLKERAGQSIAGQHFGHRLLKEVLGWSGVEPCSGSQQGESHYPISHRAFGGSVPLILRGIDAGDLDRGSAQFGQEGRKRSPHSCLQECLNADDSANWGLLLSGDRLRLLHDNPSLVKPAYLAADLELMIEGERFDEFSVLWLVLHASRFQHPNTGSCVLDDWKQKAEESGERVLGALRGGVQSALESLGWGFLNHPANGALREVLQGGQLSRQQFHEQLLRLVYRFLFLFTAEDRDLLFPREVDKADPRRRIYREGYSVSRLRELAIKRGSYEGDYGDLWELQRLVFQQLSIGNSPLGLPGLGGLFSLEQCPDLQAAELWNGPLLRAIKAIGWFDAGGTFTRVRYRDLNTEELGSVYEGLLELHPQLEQQGSQWQLSYGGGAGSDRKTTGSYYTPDALVQELIKSALVPVIDDRLSKAVGPSEQEKALLDIKVIDPACGSGHFLLAAARRLAVALSQVRAGDDQPSEDDRQHALRDVVAHCIYAVDKNPMAVELCKVALWIEAIDPGKPLSFLDAHIQCGDSLVGVFDPKVLEEGIPDEAYKPLTGDDKTVCSSLKKENAAARKTSSRGGSNRGIQGSFDLSGAKPRSRSQEALQAIEAMPEATLAESAAKQAAYANWLEQSGQDPDALAADLFTAAFFLAKTSGSRATVPTTEHLLRLLGGQPVEEAMEDAVGQASQNFRFFHWHLRFGEVMARGGFDCVLGNPPWDVSQANDKEFFNNRSPVLATLKGHHRKDAIDRLRDEKPELFDEFEILRRGIGASNEFFRSGRYPLSAKGKANLFAVFAELFIEALSDRGRAGLITPTDLATGGNTSDLFAALIKSGRLVQLIDFENGATTGKFFDIDSRYKFSLATFSASPTTYTLASFWSESPKSLSDDRKALRMGQKDFYTLSPNNYNSPLFRSTEDQRITTLIYKNVPILKAHDRGIMDSGWNISIKRLFNMGSPAISRMALEEPSPGLLAMMEGKMIHQFNPVFAGYHHNGKISKSADLLADSLSGGPEPRYWFPAKQFEQKLVEYEWSHEWLLGWRDICRGTDERTMIAAVYPALPSDLTLRTLVSCSRPENAFLLLANFNSIVFDYLLRQKIGGTHLSDYILEQVPVIPMARYSKAISSEIRLRVFSLSAGFACLKPWKEMLLSGAQTYVADSRDSSIIKSEIDAIYAHLYGLTKDELRYVLDPADVMGPDYPSETFRVLKNNEIREFGEYRTQRLVLEAWDRLFGAA
jgi:N-6 DNA Methylase